MPDARPRRGYLDWLRGIAVLIMIQAHVIDSWTPEPFRHSREFGWAVILGGFGAPLFLFLAGVSVAFSAASKARKSGNVRAAARSVIGCGLQILGLAFLFRLQSWLISGGLPSIYERSSFWRSSPSYFAIRVGILTLAVAIAYAWERRSDRGRWSPLQ